MLASDPTARPQRLEDLLDGRLMSRLERLDVRTLKMFPGKLQGERRSKRRGQSAEFEDYRNYVAGDDLRFIDWNIYARLDRLFIKVLLEEEDLAVHLALDASASMNTGRPSKLLFASRLAAALGYTALVRNNRVGVSVFGRPGASMRRMDDVRGRHHVRRLGAFLLESVWEGRDRAAGDAGAMESVGRGAGLSDALSTIARTRVGKGVMIVLSDFLDPAGYGPGLRALAAAGGYDTYCLQVLSPGEMEPEREAEQGVAGDLRLTDIETGRAAEVTVTGAVLKRYKERLADYLSELGGFCTARDMTHAVLRSDRDVGEVVFGELRRLGMVG